MDDTTGTPPSDEPAFPGFAPAPAAQASPYRVLARKYRPRTFDDLIGQDVMVRTLSNAFETGRIPQAWMLTGVRGVGKTTTARILARALNYELPDGEGPSGPTIRMPRLGIHCEAIMESRHVDVLEMDAASHTGVENIRQITDAVRYAPATARYKVYIIDEVHMLSAAAFNAFLKTLEEPPPHAKFVFATTEIRKVPVTILSRCQRFDLRRVESDKLVRHLGTICAAEGVEAEPEALAAIARAAEGSVRDSLSLLDQAIAHGAGRVAAAAVRDMLGLADRAQVIDLFEATMRGDVAAAFVTLRAQYDAGADPAVTLADLATFTHLVTRLKLVPDAGKDPALTEAERSRGAAFAQRLSIRTLSRAWQILLKGIPEVQTATRPFAAAEMVLVRLAYAADLPTPDEALRALRDGASRTVETGAAPTRSPGGPVLATAQARAQPAETRPAARRGRRAAAAPLRGFGRARRRAARHRPQGRARTRRAPRTFRRRSDRVRPRRGRQPHPRRRSLARPARMDRAALGRGLVVGAGRPDPARAEQDGGARAQERRRRAPAGPGRAEPLPGRRDRRRARQGRAPGPAAAQRGRGGARWRNLRTTRTMRCNVIPGLAKREPGNMTG